MDDKLMSQEGLDKLKQELKELEQVLRPEIVKRIEAAQEMGDISENAEYHDAKDHLALVDTRINELQETINFSTVVVKSQDSAVGIGAKVSVSSDQGIKREFEIVGVSEADPITGKISNESPIGRALIGHHVGEKVEVATPAGTTIFSIDKIV